MLASLTSRFENTVLTKEMRTRMRGTRAYWLLFFYVLALSGVLFVAYLMWYQEYAQAGYRPMAGNDPLGRRLFQCLFAAQGGLIILITPALTAGMLTIEREQRTFELLLLTMLRPRDIVAGKLMSAFGFAVLLLTASLPLAGICLMLGGISPQEVGVVYLLMALSSLFYGSIGILFSAMLRSTALSTAATYMSILFLSAITAMAGAGGKEVVFSSVNPVAAVFNASTLAPLYRWQCPTWIPAMFLILVASVLAASGAVHRLEEGISERPGILRWLALLLFCTLAAGIVGNVTGAVVAGRPGSSPAPAGAALPAYVIDELRAATAILGGVLLFGLTVLALIICSGDKLELTGYQAPNHRFRFRTLLDRVVNARLFAGGYAWGPAYMLLLFLAGGAILETGFTLTRKGLWLKVADVAGGSLLIAVAAMVAYIAITRFWSAALGNRYAAAGLSFVTIAAMVLLPLVSFIGWDSSLHPPHELFWETLYANPGIALMALAAEPGDWAQSVPALWAGQFAWGVTIIFYLGLAAVFEVAGQAILTRQRRTGKVPRW